MTLTLGSLPVPLCPSVWRTEEGELSTWGADLLVLL